MKKVLSILLLTAVTSVFADLQIDKINEAIQRNNVAWTAGHNWVTALSAEERARLCGTILEPPADVERKLVNLAPVENLPSTLDWRDNNGNWVTPVRNQASCGSCWDFSATAQVEAWWKIFNNQPDIDLDLSEQFVLSCADAGTCNGGRVELALTFFQHTGVPPETCLPYQATDFVFCEEACDDWQEKATTIPGWGYITLEEPIVENIKRALYYHPVSASYTVFDDFYSYTGGVYEHVWGDVSGGHAILIVGWNDEEQSWICKNSWGPNWGENGYFRIKWGDSGIGENIPFIYDELTQNALHISPEKIELTLSSGDSTVEYIDVTNVGNGTLQFSLIDYEVPIAFHPDEFNAYDGSSWWCGDPLLGGYNNHWLQYLDTPVIDLTSTLMPSLTFQTYWAIEPPGGTEPPWDGWDGANVWISTDLGKTFSVIHPLQPAYTCESLWAFGEPDQGWGLGPGIAGWAGNSDGWVSALFDLSPYSQKQVIIRFAFASDLAFCSQDDPTVSGFFVDDIRVADGETQLFFDDAENFDTMNPSGFGVNVADWLNIETPAAKLGPGESHQTRLSISAEKLRAGLYHGLVSISSNDSLALSDIPITLTVIDATHDLELKRVPQYASQPILTAVTPTVMVQNNGTETAASFEIQCTIISDTSRVETVMVEELVSGARQKIAFPTFVPSDSGIIRLDFSIAKNPNDQIVINDTTSTHVSISNVIDDFESENANRIAENGWTATNKFQGYNSQYAAHPNGGENYLPNMNSILTYALPLLMSQIDRDSLDVILSYWAWAITEEGIDNCYVEISSDSSTWTAVDTLTGQFRIFENFRIPLLTDSNKNVEQLWFRFRFVSNESSEQFGVVIDDIAVFLEKRQSDTAVNAESETPLTWHMQQNYPNPFNPSTTILYSVPASAHIRITIYNAAGRQVAVLVDEKQPSGTYSVLWHPQGLASGVYMYKIEATPETGNAFSALKKMLLIK